MYVCPGIYECMYVFIVQINVCVYKKCTYIIGQLDLIITEC